MIVTPFAREIKRLRTENEMTVRSLAAALSKSVSYIGKIEVQGEVPTPELIRRIADVFCVDEGRLFFLAKETLLSNYKRDVEKKYQFPIETEKRTEKPEIQEEKMATVLSLINMKGGVGKTTIAAQLAHMADRKDFRTLAVDLDPQSNLSQALMGPKKYVKHLTDQQPTVVQIFDQYVPISPSSGATGPLDVKDLIVKNAGYWSESTLDLIPSRLELSRTLKNPYSKERRLAKALAQVREEYDLIIVDCAPTESVLTEAAYFASRYLLVPIKPEFMATIGLPLLARSLQEFQVENGDHTVEIAGIVFNHSSSYSSGPEGQRSIRDVSKIAATHGWHLCENQVKYSASYPKSAREQTPISNTSYSRQDVVRNFQRLSDEVFNLIGL